MLYLLCCRWKDIYSNYKWTENGESKYVLATVLAEIAGAAYL